MTCDCRPLSFSEVACADSRSPVHSTAHAQVAVHTTSRIDSRGEDPVGADRRPARGRCDGRGPGLLPEPTFSRVGRRPGLGRGGRLGDPPVQGGQALIHAEAVWSAERRCVEDENTNHSPPNRTRVRIWGVVVTRVGRRLSDSPGRSVVSGREQQRNGQRRYRSCAPVSSDVSGVATSRSLAAGRGRVRGQRGGRLRLAACWPWPRPMSPAAARSSSVRAKTHRLDIHQESDGLMVTRP